MLDHKTSTHQLPLYVTPLIIIFMILHRFIFTNMIFFFFFSLIILPIMIGKCGLLFGKTTTTIDSRVILYHNLYHILVNYHILKRLNSLLGIAPIQLHKINNFSWKNHYSHIHDLVRVSFGRNYSILMVIYLFYIIV